MKSSKIESDLTYFSKLSHRATYHNELLIAFKPIKKLTLHETPIGYKKHMRSKLMKGTKIRSTSQMIKYVLGFKFKDFLPRTLEKINSL